MDALLRTLTRCCSCDCDEPETPRSTRRHPPVYIQYACADSGLNPPISLLFDSWTDSAYTEWKGTRLLKAIAQLDWKRASELMRRGCFHPLAVHVAVQTRYCYMVRLLVEAGIGVDMVDDSLRTPLHIAVCLRDATIAALLVQSGCQLSPLDVWYNSPLYYAAHQLHLPLVKLIVRAGARSVPVTPALAAIESLRIQQQQTGHISYTSLVLCGQIVEYYNAYRCLKRIMRRRQHAGAATVIQQWWIKVCYKPDRQRRWGGNVAMWQSGVLEQEVRDVLRERGPV